VQSYFRRHVFLPQDHGSWVFTISPLIIGIFAGGKISYATIYLVIAVLAAFLIRQPVTIAIKAYSGRRSKADLPAARFWFLTYGGILLLALLALIAAGFAYVLYLIIPALPIFAWHLWLVSRREERRQMGIEILATGILSLAAPAADWVGLGQYDSAGWWLWFLVWMQSAASIVYAYLRLEQREWKSTPNRWIRFRAGWRAYAYTSFNLLSTLSLSLIHALPRFLFVPYLLQWAETIWGIDHPALGWKPTRIGFRQLIVSTLWTILFVLIWRP